LLKNWVIKKQVGTSKQKKHPKTHLQKNPKKNQKPNKGNPPDNRTEKKRNQKGKKEHPIKENAPGFLGDNIAKGGGGPHGKKTRPNNARKEPGLT